MRAFKYWCKPIDRDSERLLFEQLAKASLYRRQIATIENRARQLRRAVLALPEAERKPIYVQISTCQSAAVRAARKEASDGGLYWGTYLQVEAAADQSQRTTLIGDDVDTFSPRDEGVLAVQIQSTSPIMADSMMGGADRRVQISAESNSDHKARRGGIRHELRVRVGSNGRDPIWSLLHIILHRPLPHERVTWVLLRCRRTAMRYRWEASVLVDGQSVGVPNQDRAAGVGVDLNWRRVEGGIRTATWVGSDGRMGELVIPEAVSGRAAKSDSLRAIRDRSRDQMRGKILEWIRVRQELDEADGGRGCVAGQTSRLGPWRDVEEMRKDLPHVHSWRRVGRFVRLHRLWSQHATPDSEEILVDMAAWLKQDRHLWDWECHNRRRMTLQVQGRVAQLVAKLACEYEVIAVERTGMVPSLVRRDPTNDRDEERQRRLNAQRVAVVAPAAIRRGLKVAGAKYSAKYVEVDPAYTTATCSMCGATRSDDHGQQLIECHACGATGDRAYNAARNLLANGLALVRDADGGDNASSGVAKRKLGARRNRKSKRPATDRPLETPTPT